MSAAALFRDGENEKRKRINDHTRTVQKRENNTIQQIDICIYKFKFFFTLCLIYKWREGEMNQVAMTINRVRWNANWD